MRRLLLALLLAGLASAAVLSESTRSVEKKITPLSCYSGEKSFTVWRELEVRETVFVDSLGNRNTQTVSTITVHLRNDAGMDLNEVEFRELVPDSVAKNPGDLFGFSMPPQSVERGSTVISWLFNDVKQNEEKNVSYSVNGSVDSKALKDYQKPQIVVGKTKGGWMATVELILSATVVFFFIIASLLAWVNFTTSFQKRVY